MGVRGDEKGILFMSEIKELRVIFQALRGETKAAISATEYGGRLVSALEKWCRLME